jgi:PleD family two-component response regulator
VLLPETDETAAQAAVERLRDQVLQTCDAFLRISVGTATGQEGSSLQEVMREADDRMYLDKFSKRTRVEQA